MTHASDRAYAATTPMPLAASDQRHGSFDMFKGPGTTVADDPNFKIIEAAFPQIARKIALFWGYAELVTYLRDLQGVADDRARTGFPSGVLFSIDQLAAQHDRQFPQLARINRDFWDIY